MTAAPEDVVADLGRENARLRDELKLARDRQNASAEILRAIAGASGDAEHSLKQIAETTARLFRAPSVTIRLAEGWEWGKSIHFGAISELIRTGPNRLPRLDGETFRDGVSRNRQVHIPRKFVQGDRPVRPRTRTAGGRAPSRNQCSRTAWLARFTDAEFRCSRASPFRRSSAIDKRRPCLQTCSKAQSV